MIQLPYVFMHTILVSSILIHPSISFPSTLTSINIKQHVPNALQLISTNTIDDSIHYNKNYQESFFNRKDPRRRRNHKHHNTMFRRQRKTASNTELNVLTTPESIIEQASTKKLLDDLIDESVRLSARKPIMMQFQPTPYWIWKRWKGTIFAESWPICLRNMCFAYVVSLVFHVYPNAKKNLLGFNILWGQLLSVTTFTLTFFLNVSYGLWRKCYGLSRRLQGRLNDLGLTLAAHAVRNTPTNPTDLSTYTSGSRQILELVSRYTRLFNILTYASFTRSHRPILTPRGMRRLVERGLMTPLERKALIDADVPATQRHNAVLLWIVRVVIEGRASGHFLGGAGFESEFLEKVHVIRAQVGGIGDELQGRMPLAYAHIVQVLVDVILLLYPFMAFTSEMSTWVGVAGTALLSIFYQGLFDLAKQFLDPYDNENFGNGDDPLCVDTLVAETNAGSIRWMNGFNEMPFSSQKISEGELNEYLLPLKGYSVQELKNFKKDQEEKDRKQKLEEDRLRSKKKHLLRSKRLELLSKYYFNKENQHKSKGWVVKKVATLSDQTIITYELRSSDNVYSNATTASNTSATTSTTTMPWIMNDTDVSTLLVKLLCKASTHLVYTRNNPTRPLLEQVQEEPVTEEEPVIEAQVVAANSTVDTSMTDDTTATTPGLDYNLTMSLLNNVASAVMNESSIISTIPEETMQLEPENYTTKSSYPTPFYHNVTATSKERHISTFDSSDTAALLEDGNEEDQPQQLDILMQKKEENMTFTALQPPSAIINDGARIEGDSDVTTNPESPCNHTSSDQPHSIIEEEQPSIQIINEQSSSSTTTPTTSTKEKDDTFKYLQVENNYDYSDLWLDEISPDGTEIRLSQLLADEEWDDNGEDVITTPPPQRQQPPNNNNEEKKTTVEEEENEVQKIFEERINEANEEWKETEAILRTSPGRDSNEDDIDFDLSSSRYRREKKLSMDLPLPPVILPDSSNVAAATTASYVNGYYDQTALDGISQLWGASPHILGKNTEVSTSTSASSSDTNMDGIAALWSGSDIQPPSKSATTAVAAATSSSSDSMFVANVDGIADLWSGTDIKSNQGSASQTSSRTASLDTMDDNFPSMAQLWDVVEPEGSSNVKKSSTRIDIHDDDGTNNSVLNTLEPFDGLEWFDEIGPDGKEIRLSQLLADDDWDEDNDIHDDNDYYYTDNIATSIPTTSPSQNSNTVSIQEVIDKLEEEEEERIETEAILNAAPGANFVEGLDDDDDFSDPLLKERIVPEYENGSTTSLLEQQGDDMLLLTTTATDEDTNYYSDVVVLEQDEMVMDMQEQKETEAILNAAPGANSLEQDEDHDDSTITDPEDIIVIENSNNDNEGSSSGSNTTDALDILEMDEKEENTEILSSDSSILIDDIVFSSLEDSIDIDTDDDDDDDDVHLEVEEGSSGDTISGNHNTYDDDTTNSDIVHNATATT